MVFLLLIFLSVFLFYGFRMNRINRRILSELSSMEKKNQDLNTRFDRITLSTDLGVWYCDLPFDELMWNEKTKEHFWLAPDTRVTIDLFYEHIHPEDRERTKRAIEASIQNRTQYDIEYRTIRKNSADSWKWIRAIGWTDYNKDGNPIRFDGITFDITETKAAAEDFSDVLEKTTEGFFTVDSNWRMTYANPVTQNFMALLGREIIGKTMVELFPSPDRLKFMEHYERIASTGISERFLETYEGRVLAVHAYRRRDGGLAIFYRDVTEREEALRALRDSEHQFREMADTMPQVVWMASPTGEITYANRQWYELTGFSEDETFGHGWGNALHPDDLGPTTIVWQNALTSQTTVEVSYRIRTRKGEYRHQLVKGVPIFREGVLSFWLGTITDVQDFKAGQERLRQSEEKLELTLTAANIGYWEHDVKTHKGFLSETLRKSWGIDLPAEEVTLEKSLLSIHPDDRESVRLAVAKATDTRTPYDLEYRVIKSDGALIWVHAKGQCQYDERGEPERLTGITIDVTDRHLAEETIRSNEKHLRLITDSIPSFISYIRASDLTYDFVNSAYEKFFGKKKKDIEGHSVKDVLGSRFENSRAYFERALKKEFVSFSTNLTSDDGEERNLNVHYIPDVSDKGDTRGIIVLGNDVTELSKALKDRDLFLSMASHELKTPLTAMLLQTQVQRKLDPENRYPSLMERHVKRLTILIDDMLDVSRIRTGKMTFNLQPIQLSKLVQEMVFDLHDSRIVVMDAAPHTITADPGRVEQVLMNLLTNAQKYGGSGAIKVRIASEGSEVHIDVSDSGPGIPESSRERIFNAFERASGTQAIKGLGLGLFISRSLMEEMGGSLELIPSSAGATFRMKFPNVS